MGLVVKEQKITLMIGLQCREGQKLYPNNQTLFKLFRYFCIYTDAAAVSEEYHEGAVPCCDIVTLLLFPSDCKHCLY